MTKKDQVNQSIAKVRIIDYLLMTDDPTRRAIFNINKLARANNLKDWLKEKEPGYFIPNDKMPDYMEL